MQFIEARCQRCRFIQVLALRITESFTTRHYRRLSLWRWRILMTLFRWLLMMAASHATLWARSVNAEASTGHFSGDIIE